MSPQKLTDLHTSVDAVRWPQASNSVDHLLVSVDSKSSCTLPPIKGAPATTTSECFSLLLSADVDALQMQGEIHNDA